MTADAEIPVLYMTFNQHMLYWENYQVCNVTWEGFALLRHQSQSWYVPLYVYFIFQSHAVWCNCSKDTIWYFGFFFLEVGGLDKFCASSSVWDGMATYRERACSTRLWPQSF